MCFGAVSFVCSCVLRAGASVCVCAKVCVCVVWVFFLALSGVCLRVGECMRVCVCAYVYVCESLGHVFMVACLDSRPVAKECNRLFA